MSEDDNITNDEKYQFEIARDLYNEGFIGNPIEVKKCIINDKMNIACLNGDLDEVKRISVEEGVFPTIDGSCHPLRTAIAQGHKDIVRYLLSSGLDPNQKGSLYAVLFLGDIEMAEILLSYGAELTKRQKRLLWESGISTFCGNTHKSAHRRILEVAHRI